MSRGLGGDGELAKMRINLCVYVELVGGGRRWRSRVVVKGGGGGWRWRVVGKGGGRVQEEGGEEGWRREEMEGGAGGWRMRMRGRVKEEDGNGA